MRRQELVLDSLNSGLQRAFADDPRPILLGEDILDPYGGAFKVTRGLSSLYPERVWSTPISEAGIVGVAAGMAMRGLLPVVEIMFGDFLTLAADQIINHIAKFSWMYSGGKTASQQVRVPLVIRTPMGGRRGYGPTHSQTLEKHFLGLPGLRTVAPSHFGDPGSLLYTALLADNSPVLFIENKLQYLLPIGRTEDQKEFDVQAIPGAYPLYHLSLRGAPPAQLTLAAYGYMAELARQAALRLAYEFEVFTEIIIPTQLSPFELDTLFASLHRTHRMLAIEEGNLTLGWGAEVLALAAERLGSSLKAAGRLAARDCPVPASGPLEGAALPDVEQIIEKCLEIVQTR